MKAFLINDKQMVIAPDMASACEKARTHDVTRMQQLPYEVVADEPRRQPQGADHIIDSVCDTLCLDRESTLSPSRMKQYAEARFIICYILNRHQGKTFRECAAIIKRDNHATVFNAVCQIEAAVERKEPLGRKLQKCLDDLGIRI